MAPGSLSRTNFEIVAIILAIGACNIVAFAALWWAVPVPESVPIGAQQTDLTLRTRQAESDLGEVKLRAKALLEGAMAAQAKIVDATRNAQRRAAEAEQFAENAERRGGQAAGWAREGADRAQAERRAAELIESEMARFVDAASNLVDVTSKVRVAANGAGDRVPEPVRTPPSRIGYVMAEVMILIGAFLVIVLVALSWRGRIDWSRFAEPINWNRFVERIRSVRGKFDRRQAVALQEINQAQEDRFHALEQTIRTLFRETDARTESSYRVETLETKFREWADALRQWLPEFNQRLLAIEVKMGEAPDARSIESASNNLGVRATQINERLSEALQSLARIELGIEGLGSQLPPAAVIQQIPINLQNVEKILATVVTQIRVLDANLSKSIEDVKPRLSTEGSSIQLRIEQSRGPSVSDPESADVSTRPTESSSSPVLFALLGQLRGLDKRFANIETVIGEMPKVGDLDRILLRLTTIESRIHAGPVPIASPSTLPADRPRGLPEGEHKPSPSVQQGGPRISTAAPPVARPPRLAHTAASGILSPEAREMCDIYNLARENKIGYRDQFNKRYQPSRLDCVNAHERRAKGVDLPPVFQENEAGEYLVVEMRGSYYCFPFWTTIIDDPNNAIRSIGGMDDVFDFEDNATGLAAQPRVVVPARVMQSDERWEPIEKGLIRA